MAFLGFYIDPIYLRGFFITLVISIAAQVFMSSTYRNWDQVRNGLDLSGTEAGYAFFNRTGMGEGKLVALSELGTPELKKYSGLEDKGFITDQEYQTKRKEIGNSRASNV